MILKHWDLLLHGNFPKLLYAAENENKISSVKLNMFRKVKVWHYLAKINFSSNLPTQIFLDIAAHTNFLGFLKPFFI